MGTVMRYSEAFKLQVVREVESGRHGSCHAASEAYGIRGIGTVSRWVAQYGKSHLLRKVVRVETVDERNEVKRLKVECRKLKEALADAHLDLRLERSCLKLACRAAGQDDVEEFKKKTGWEIVHDAAGEGGAPMKRLVSGLCRRAGMSRQNYYARRRRRQRRKVDEGLVLNLVRRERQEQPRLGGRKVMRLIREDVQEAGVTLGRDRLFSLLRENGLLVEPKPRCPKTTNSRHSLPVFRNEVAGMEVTAPNQVWVSDLTYIRTAEGFLYAALVTDKFSRKIVGCSIGDTLEAVGCLRALDMALEGLPAGGPRPVHHSDRGSQYCCHLYVERLQAAGLRISMTEKAHCYENALAERVNGILKQEYEMDATFRTKAQAVRAFEQAVHLYNHRRPHLALNYRFPAEVHRTAA